MKTIPILLLALFVQGCFETEPKRTFRVDGSLSFSDSHVIGELLYILNSGGMGKPASLVGLDRFKGKEVWRYEHTNEEDYITDFLIVDRVLFLGSESLIISIDLDTREENWRFTNDRFPKVSGRLQLFFRDGILLNPYDSGYFVAFDANTGEVKWVNKTVGELAQFRPIYDSEVLYFSVFSSENNIIAVDFETGKTLWSRSLPGKTSRMPRVHDGALFVATNDSLTPDQPDLFRLNLETGDTIWSKKVPETQSLGKIEIVGDILLTVSASSDTGFRYLSAIDVEDGRTVWIKESRNSEFAMELTDLGVDRNGMTVFAVLEGKLERINIETGKARWYSRLKDGGARVLFVRENMCYLSSLRISVGADGVETPIEKVMGFRWHTQL